VTSGHHDSLFDVDSAVYVSLDDIDANLSDLWREHFLDQFFLVSELSRERRGQAKGMLGLHRGVAPDGTLFLRVEFPFMGITEWHEWDGTEQHAMTTAEDMGSARVATLVMTKPMAPPAGSATSTRES